MSRNELREKINNAQIEGFSEINNTTMYMCNAEDNRTKSNKNSTTEIQNK